ncbi:MAG TPA: sugar transferase [Pyrinomonadaceae bacterium]|jgi:exopolysaccharide biosynthesis polyprenyl glycosylphosphotransferase|nr:sugar transferase [Pyrinomonadaceae bacterium]
MRAERSEKLRVSANEVRAKARAPRWVVPAVKAALVLADAVVAVASFAAAYVLREGGGVLVRFSPGAGVVWQPRFQPYAALLWFVVVVRLISSAYYDLYGLRGEFSYMDECVRVFRATAVGSLLVVAWAFLYRGGFEFRSFSYARGVFVLDFLLALGAYIVLRLATRGAQSAVRRREVNLIPTLVVGRGAEAAMCVREMRARRELGYRVIGVVETVPLGDEGPREFEGVPVVADLSGLPEAIRATGANEVIITDPGVSGDLLFEVMMRVGRRRGVEFRVAPSLFNCLPRKTGVEQIGVLPFITLFREPLGPGARVLKRASDIIIAATALVLLAPVWLVVALLIKLDSRGPVLYAQERVGMDGRIFLFLKFRTMLAGADDREHREYQRRYIKGQPDTNLGDSLRPVYKLHTDPRVTRMGRILRRASLDELPQLLNVLRGDMSVVGPRPPIPYEVESYDLWHRKRLDMKPGMTGLWQVSGRNRLSFDEMVRLDLFYIENWSLWLDLKIVLRTLPVLLRGEAY